MSKAISITRHESDTRGRYEARVDGIEGVGQLTYSRLSPDKIIAEHTSVDDSLRGTGVGEALVIQSRTRAWTVDLFFRSVRSSRRSMQNIRNGRM